MNCFRYIDVKEQDCVEMRLFRAENGTPQADISGPMAGYTNQAFSHVVELVHCATLDDAFETAIRMANRNDTELVVSGNSELWQRKWGTLEGSANSLASAQTSS